MGWECIFYCLTFSLVNGYHGLLSDLPDKHTLSIIENQPASVNTAVTLVYKHPELGRTVTRDADLVGYNRTALATEAVHKG